MDVDPIESATGAADEMSASRDRERVRLGTWVAITVALLATFLGLCKVKDDNIVQAMQQAQADKLDHWNFYEARNIREEVAAAATQLRLAAAGAPSQQQEGYGAVIASYERLIADQAAKKEDVRTDCDGHFVAGADGIDPQAMAILVGAAADRRGGVMGLAGLLGWHLHLDSLSRLLS